MSLRQILLQVARTAAMALAGAGALLLVLHLLAGLPNGHLLIVIALAAPLGVLFGWVTVRALRSGALPYRFGVDRRDRNPVTFWVGVVIYAAGAAALGVMSLWALVQVVAGLAV
jgi:hypothetical protein